MPRVVKLVGSTTVSNLLKLIKSEPDSYEKYASGDLRVIGLPSFEHMDSVVKDQMSYSQWISTKHQYKTVKVEGLEKSLAKYFKQLDTKDIHLFVNQKTSYSFKWHADNVDVFLFVLKGHKRLQIKNKSYILTAGTGAFIPKGYLHRAFSRKGTWALSIGLK